jgi:hypothetical protein
LVIEVVLLLLLEGDLAVVGASAQAAVVQERVAAVVEEGVEKEMR